MSLLSKRIKFFQLWVIKRGIIDIKNMFEKNFNRNKPIGKKLACLAKNLPNLPSLASLPCLPCQRDFPGNFRPQLLRSFRLRGEGWLRSWKISLWSSERGFRKGEVGEGRQEAGWASTLQEHCASPTCKSGPHQGRVSLERIQGRNSQEARPPDPTWLQQG